MDRLSAARERFKQDLFATEQTGVVLEAVDKDYARCSMRVEARHMNANGVVMGGALFTLADLAFAAAANEQQPLTVSLTSQITYLNPGQGKVMYAEARAVKSGKRNCTFIIDVTDEKGVQVAVVISTGARIG